MAVTGRKRVAPEPVGQAPARPTSAELMPPPPPRSSGGQQDGRHQRLEPTPVGAGPGALAPTAGRGASSAAGGAGAGEGGLAVAARPHVILRRAEVPAEVVADLGSPLRLFEDPAAPAAAAAEARRRTLRITNRERAVAGGGGRAAARVQADVECLEGGSPLWTDRLQGAAVAACGTHNFAAVALSDGQLVVSAALGNGGGQSCGAQSDGSCAGSLWHCTVCAPPPPPLASARPMPRSCTLVRGDTWRRRSSWAPASPSCAATPPGACWR